MTERTCLDCAHHHAHAYLAEYGECRRYPPRDSKLGPGGVLIAVYPVTSDALPQCGEFRTVGAPELGCVREFEAGARAFEAAIRPGLETPTEPSTPSAAPATARAHARRRRAPR